MCAEVIEEFREDHRIVRDSLIELASALERKEIDKAREVLERLNKLLGPHFRFEEEKLYPTLRKFLGEYVDKLLEEHDTAISSAKELAELLSKEDISDEEAKEAASKVRGLLVHVSNCDGLAILAERLSEEEIKDLEKTFSEFRSEGVPLLEWAEKIRVKA